MRFLILTSDSGFGHRTAANAIARALALRHPRAAETIVVNPIIERPAFAFLQNTERSYDSTVKKTRLWYRFTYEISNSRFASSVVEKSLVLILQKNLRALFQEVRPDVILNTVQTFNAPIGSVLNSMQPRPPFYTVVTDLGEVHALWFNADPDHFFVGSEEVQAQAASSGIDPRKISISGIPVDPDFGTKPADMEAARRRLGLQPGTVTLLFVGSRRVSGIPSHLNALEGVALPFQVVVIAGGDQKLYQRVMRRQWNFPIQVKDYVTNMAEWMHCADVLVTKAGGLILSEGLAAGLPMVLIDSLPGQEEGNVRFILERQAGVRVKNPAEFAQLAGAWLEDHHAGLSTAAANARKAGRPEAAFVIADALWQAAVQGAEGGVPYSSAWSSRE